MRSVFLPIRRLTPRVKCAVRAQRKESVGIHARGIALCVKCKKCDVICALDIARKLVATNIAECQILFGEATDDKIDWRVTGLIAPKSFEPRSVVRCIDVPTLPLNV